MRAYGAINTEPITSLILDGTTCTLTTKSPAITTDGVFDYDVIVKPSKVLTSLVLRFDVTRDSGALIYRRTRYIQPDQIQVKANDDAAHSRRVKQLTENFSRDLVGLGMPEGAYNISVTVTVATKNEQTTAALNDTLLVYQPDVASQPVIPVVRVNYAPTRNSKGHFTIDPAGGQAYDQTAALMKLCRWVQTTKAAKVTLVLSPQLVAEWADLADGYTLANDAKNPIAATDPTSQHYLNTLNTVKQALKTQRVTLAWTGYGDPHLGELNRHQLNAAIHDQYRKGREVLEKLLGVAPSALTAPAGLTVASNQLPLLRDLNMSRIVISQTTAPKAKHSVSRVGSGITSLITADEVSAQLGTPQDDRFLQGLFGLRTKNSEQPVVLDITLGQDKSRTDALVDQIALIESQPWLTLVNPMTVKVPSPDIVKLTPQKTASDGTHDTATWKQIRESYNAASNLALAIQDLVLGDSILTDALSSQCLTQVAGSSVAQRNELTDDYLQAVNESTSKIVDGIKLTVAPITLASSSGALPVTITNTTGQVLNTTLVYEASDSVLFEGSTEQEILLPDKDSFFEPKLSLRGSLSSNVTVKVMAGKYVISQKTVRVSASYTDRIVIVIGVALLGVVLVLFVRKRSVGALKQDEAKTPANPYAETDHE